MLPWNTRRSGGMANHFNDVGLRGNDGVSMSSNSGTVSPFTYPVIDIALKPNENLDSALRECQSNEKRQMYVPLG